MSDFEPAQAPVSNPAKDSRAPGMSEGLRLVGRASGVGISTGCLTAVGTLLALFAGLWLDGQMGTRPLFTLGFVLTSIPLTLGLMTWWVLRESKRIAGEERVPAPKEEA